MYSIIGSKELVENESDLSIFTVLADNFETVSDASQWFQSNFINDDHYVNLYKHVHIICEDVMVYEYWYRHKWLPKDAWFMLVPVYDKIKKYVDTSYNLPYKHLSINNDSNTAKSYINSTIMNDFSNIMKYYNININHEEILETSSEDVS